MRGGKKANLEGANSQPFFHHSPKNSLNIMYYNARSLLPKFDELATLCELHQPGIVCIVETWLSPEVTDSEISINSYQVVRLDRNRHGGGILMYVHDNLSYKIIAKGPDALEFLMLSIYNKCNKLCIGLFYRPPNSLVDVFDNFCTTLEYLDTSRFSNFILLGDFKLILIFITLPPPSTPNLPISLTAFH